jgi:hypothetical protein
VVSESKNRNYPDHMNQDKKRCRHISPLTSIRTRQTSW